MKKTSKWGLLLLTAGFTAFALFGCQSADTSKANTNTESSDETVISDSDSDAELLPDSADAEQTDPSEIGGEGTTDDTLPDLTGLTTAPLEEPCAIEGVSGEEFCTLTINSIETTDERNEGDEDSPEKVIIVDYTYENTSSGEPILLDDMSFKLLEDDTVCQPYYLSNLTPAEPAETDQTSTGQIAFSVTKKCKSVTLYFENAATGATAVFETSL